LADRLKKKALFNLAKLKANQTEYFSFIQSYRVAIDDIVNSIHADIADGEKAQAESRGEDTRLPGPLV